MSQPHPFCPSFFESLMTVTGHSRYPIEDRLPKGYDTEVTLATFQALVWGFAIFPHLEARDRHGRPPYEPWHDGLISLNFTTHLNLKLDLQDSRLISDGPPGLLDSPVGLVLANRRPFWGHPTPVTSRQGFAHCDYGCHS